MTKRRRAPTQPTPAAGANPRGKASRLRLLLLLSSVGVLCTLVAIRSLDLRLGQGSFAYRFSLIYAVRLFRAIPALVVVLGVAGAIKLMARGPSTGSPRRVRGGIALFSLTSALLVVWAWFAPPSAIQQHVVNFVSPAQDGAFVVERDNMIRQHGSIADYVRNFDERLNRSTEDMRGTRVLSNPPGATVLAAWVHAVWPPQTNPAGWLERWTGAPEVFKDRPILSDGLRLAIVLHAIWGLSLIPAYAVARLYLPPASAAVTALLMWFTPSAVLFTPGKDPAQLMAVLTMTWAMLASQRRRSFLWASLLAALGSAALVAGMTLGLIHFWVMLALACAMLWHAAKSGRDEVVRLLLRQTLPAVVGASLLVALVYQAIGWNMLATFLAVASRFRQIQPELQLNHNLWLVIGLPIFILFLSPATCTTIALNLRRLRRGAGFGRKLLICTIASMLATYVFGVPYELPRLWVVFLPLVALGAAIDLPLFRARRGAHRAAPALMLIAVVHLLFVIVQFSLMDVRETEYRMLTQRLWY